MILEALVNEGKIAHCASVCREWQAAIERVNFQSLSLAARDVPIFEIMTKRNFRLIKYIWYSIELQEYDCSKCSLREEEREMDTNCIIIEHGLQTMLRALSKHPLDGELTLDISIHSLSDSDHLFKYICFQPIDEPGLRKSFEQEPRSESMHNSLATSLSIDAIDRLFPNIMFSQSLPDFWTSMPLVPCITELLLRRQTRRRWNPIILSELINRLPNLRTMHFEPWREWDRLYQKLKDLCSMLCFKSLAANHLEKMIIFEDFNDTYISMNSSDTDLFPSSRAEPIRTPASGVTQFLANASLGLECFSAAFITDAKQFWEVCKVHWVWERLLLLSLTSRELVPQNSLMSINELIHSAAKATKRMPKLGTMEIWNGGQGYAAVFRYRRKTAEGCSRISWRGSWELKFEAEVVTAWENAVEATYAGYMQVRNEMLEASQIRSHGEAILLLGLEVEVACSASIQQIHREHLQMQG